MKHTFPHKTLSWLTNYTTQTATAQGVEPLGASVKDDTTDNKRTEKQWTKCQRFVKLKELQADTQANAFAAHLILPNRTQAHPPPDKWTIDNLSATFDINRL